MEPEYKPRIITLDKPNITNNIHFGRNNDFNLMYKPRNNSLNLILNPGGVVNLSCLKKSVFALRGLVNVPELFDLITAIDISNEWLKSKDRLNFVMEVIRKYANNEAGVSERITPSDNIIEINCISSAEYREPFIYYKKMPSYIYNGLIKGNLAIGAANDCDIINDLGIENINRETKALIKKLKDYFKITLKKLPVPKNLYVI